GAEEGKPEVVPRAAASREPEVATEPLSRQRGRPPWLAPAMAAGGVAAAVLFAVALLWRSKPAEAPRAQPVPTAPARVPSRESPPASTAAQQLPPLPSAPPAAAAAEPTSPPPPTAPSDEPTEPPP